MIKDSRLLGLARTGLRRALAGQKPPRSPEGAEWHRPTALFVTLRQHGRLRGCMGSPHPRKPLAEALDHYSRNAAFRDPRFPPLQNRDLEEVLIQVSLLSPLQELRCTSDRELLEQLEPGRHGLFLATAGTGNPHKSSLFLPAVWEHFPGATEFLRQLRRKGRIEAQDGPLQAWSFTAEEFREPGRDPAPLRPVRSGAERAESQGFKPGP